MEKIKEFLGKFSDRTRKIIIGCVVGAAVIAGAVILALSLRQKPYEVMFTGVGSEESKQIIGKLQEDGVAYQFKDGDILVPAEEVDTTKAKLVSEGYPKSGFTYDVFKNNVNLMTTDSDRQTFKLYDLETRIGSTIQLFDGVKEAYVTLALGETSKYALSDDTENNASAQAVVVMKDGGSPTKEQAKSIQLLISRSIPGMVIDNVAVFDGSGREVSTGSEDEDISSGKAGEEISRAIEDQICAKVMNVVGPIYGNGNVRVSAKASVNMEKLIRESTVYNTPDKIDENDKTGLVSQENSTREVSGDGNTAAGVAGTETNADIPEYNAGAADANNGYASNSMNKTYLLNQIKEQGEVNPGALDDLTVSVAINGTGFGTLTVDDLKDLAGNAAGIAQVNRAEKITVVAAPFYTVEVPSEEPVEAAAGGLHLSRWVLMAVAGAGLLLILLIVLAAAAARRRRKREQERMLEVSQEDVPEVTEGFVPEEIAAAAEGKEESEPEEVEEVEEEEDIDYLSMIEKDKVNELRENVRDFADQNPEISAQMLKLWLNGGNDNGN